MLKEVVLGSELLDETDAELERLYKVRKPDTDPKDWDACLSNLIQSLKEMPVSNLMTFLEGLPITKH